MENTTDQTQGNLLTDWTYSDPQFDFEQVKSDWETPWSGHKSFGYDAILNFKPSTVVELGTAGGTSMFSFCQAVKDHSLKTELFAIDSWEGDAHAGAYSSSVYDRVVHIKEKLYGDVNLHLMKMYFEDAVSKFDNSTVDLLHIDGLHTYEAVKNDFDTWLPKMKSNGIILFHDIAESKDDFGVFKFWAELKEKYGTLEFRHSHGLGVLFLSPDMYAKYSGVQDQWNIEYLRKVYQRTKASLYESKVKLRELDEIKNSKFYQTKESVKKLLGK